MSTVYTLEDIVEKTGACKEEITSWEEAKLLTPLGRSEKDLPFFGADHIQRIEQIKKFLELGYTPEDIQKIIKKIGLPSREDSKKGPKKEELLTVGVLAEKIDISPRTIKHWEEKGIIEPDMRSQGGFRLYNRHYIYLASLIKDLQHFGYTLDEIKIISDYFRYFFKIKESEEEIAPDLIEEKIIGMNSEIDQLYRKIALLKEGIGRWEDLVKKNKKEITGMLTRSRKRLEKKEKQNDAKE
ncbi:MAG: MerR family transcriptional regulator [Spirochaetales bacterium]|nr:MerR family transcriptional regulator [Spirochaetales bacterium]